MRLRLSLVIIIICAGIALLLFHMNEARIIEKATPFFPGRDENTPGYYADMMTFIFTEAIWMIFLLGGTVILMTWKDFESTYESIDKFFLKRSKNTLFAVCMLFVVVTTLIATWSLEQFPNSADEYVYLLQAQQLSEGKLWDEVHPQPEFFQFHHTAHKDGKWIGRFPPGWPLILSVAYILHIPPFMINVIIGLLAILVFHKLLKKIYDERIALWGTIFLAFSSFFIFNAASYFSHMICLLEGLLFVYFGYKYFEDHRVGDALIAGFFMGTLIMTRQLTALIFFVPLALFTLYYFRIKAVAPLIFLGIGAMPSVAFFLWYNYTITGDPFVPVTMWTNADEALGFVKGHTPMQGLKFTLKRLMMFLYFASPALLIFYFWFLFIRLKDYRRILNHPEDYLFLLLIVGYFFYYHSGGNQYGPRFYLEGLPFVIAFVLVKILRSDNRFMKAFLLCSLAYCIIKIPFIAIREHRVIEERKDIYAQVKEKNIHNAVVFISSETGVIRPMPVEDLTRNDRYFQNDVLYARDLGEKNIDLIRFYDNRDFYLYKRGLDDPTGELLKINIANTHPAEVSSETVPR